MYTQDHSTTTANSTAGSITVEQQGADREVPVRILH